jgi:hypothetical protein
MLPTNYDTARLRVDDWMRQADHDRLVKEARAARKASRPQGSGLVAALHHAATFRPWKRGTQTISLSPRSLRTHP